jgi:DNA-binding transcriptional LysR family regulator
VDYLMHNRHNARVTIDELRWFVALAQNGHMTAAASELHIAQPTLSRALSRLEAEVGSPLFDRVNRRLRLNAYGEILLAHARRCLAELDTAASRIQTLRDPESGTIRLTFLHSLATWLVPELLRRYRGDMPGIGFELRQAAGHELLQALREGEVDLGVTGPRPNDENLNWQTIHRERLCLVVPRDHRLAGRRQIALAAARDDRFVALGPDFGFRRLTDELCSQAGFRPTIAFESSEIPSMEALVAAGLGVAVVPTPRPYRAEPSAVYIPLTDSEANRAIGLVWRNQPALPPPAERFARFVATGDWPQVPI